MKKMFSVKTFMVAFSFFAISAAAHAAKFDSYVNITNNSSHDMKISDRWSDDKTDVNISKTTLAPGETSSVTINSNHTLKIHRFDLLVDWQNYRGNPVEDNLQLQTDATLFAGKVSVFPREGTSSFNKNYITGDIKITDSDHHNSISFMIGDKNIAPAKYTLTSTVATGNGTVNPDGTTSLWSGDNQIITAAPAADYHLGSLNINGETIDTSSNQYTVSNISTDTIVKAYFEHNDITVKVSASEGGTINQTGNINLAYGKSLSLTATPDKGYDFSGWAVDGVDQGNDTTLTLSDVEQNKTVTANFSKQNLLVSVSTTKGGSVDQTGDVSVTYGNDLTLTATPAQNYSFTEWIVNGEDKGNNNSITLSNITNETTVQAIFELNMKSNVVFESKIASDNNITQVSIDGNSLILNENNVSSIYKKINNEWEKKLSYSTGTNSVATGACNSLIATNNGLINIFVSSDNRNQSINNVAGLEGNEFDSVCIDKAEGIAGAPNSIIDGLTNCGSVYILNLTDVTSSIWTEEQLPSPSDIAVNDHFGSSVSISNNTAIIGAKDKSIDSLDNAGAAYIYVKGNNGWENTKELTCPDGNISNNKFASQVAISETNNTIYNNYYAIVSAPGMTGDTGSVYIYHGTGSDWSNVAKLKPHKGIYNFGSKIAIDGYNALVEGTKQNGQKTVYIYRRLNSNTWDDGIELNNQSSDLNGTFALKGDEMILCGTDNNTYIYNNLQGNEIGWTKTDCYSDKAQVITFTGNDNKKYYELNSDYNGYYPALEYSLNASLNNYKFTWNMNYPKNEFYNITFKCETKDGVRYVKYTNRYTEGSHTWSYDSDGRHFESCGIDQKYSSNNWETVTKDLQADLAVNEPNNTITKVDSVLYDGGGLVTLPSIAGVNAI